jgi:hypothetical protein
MFDQPMDKPSVESAIQGSPVLSGKFSWKGDSTLTFIPDQPYLPSTPISFIVNTTARAANGLGLPAPVSLEYRTAPPLQLIQSLPANGARDAAPDSAIVASFNSPVVPLGASSGPAGFTLQPDVKGKGEWLNTSTYIFYPQPSLAGGTAYTVSLNPDLISTDGAPLDKDTVKEWAFNTTFPKIDLVQPQNPDLLRLDGPLTIRFNIAMDPNSVEANFALTGASGNPIPGKITWNDSQTSLTYEPEKNLERNTAYHLSLKGAAQARGGVALGTDFSTDLTTFPALAVTGAAPAQNGVLNDEGNGYDQIVLTLSAPLNSRVDRKWFSFSPEIFDINPWSSENGTQLTISAYFQSSTTYTLTISPDFPDDFGGTLGQPYHLTFHTSPAKPALDLTINQRGSQVTFLTPQDTGLMAQVTNLNQVNAIRGTLPLKDFFQLLGPNGYAVFNAYTPQNPTT